MGTEKVAATKSRLSPVLDKSETRSNESSGMSGSEKNPARVDSQRKKSPPVHQTPPVQVNLSEEGISQAKALNEIAPAPYDAEQSNTAKNDEITSKLRSRIKNVDEEMNDLVNFYAKKIAKTAKSLAEKALESPAVDSTSDFDSDADDEL